MSAAPAPAPNAQPPRGKPAREDRFADAMKTASERDDEGPPRSGSDDAPGADEKVATGQQAFPPAPDAAALAAMLAPPAGSTSAAKAASAPPSGETATDTPAASRIHAAAKDVGLAMVDGAGPAGPAATAVATFLDAQRAATALATDTAAPADKPPSVALAAHHLDLARDDGWLDGLARDIARSADPSGHLRFTLAPEQLGRLDVRLSAAADGTAIRLTTETREAHRIIADAQPRLVAEARAQGLTVSGAQVDLDQRDRGQPQAFGNQNGGGGGQPRRQAAWTVPSAIAPVATAVADAGGDDLYA